MKTTLAVIFTLTVVAIGIYIYAFSQPLFDVERQRLTDIHLPYKDYTIAMDYIPGNATSQDYIQASKVKDGKEEAIKNYKHYTSVFSYSLLTDSTLKILLSTRTQETPDTFILKLPKG